MNGSSGSDCGYDEKALVAGSAALASGDRAAAENAFKALSIHKADRRRFEEIYAPYRESDFGKNLALARAGIELAPKLGSWIEY